MYINISTVCVCVKQFKDSTLRLQRALCVGQPNYAKCCASRAKKGARQSESAKPVAAYELLLLLLQATGNRNLLTFNPQPSSCLPACLLAKVDLENGELRTANWADIPHFFLSNEFCFQSWRAVNSLAKKINTERRGGGGEWLTDWLPHSVLATLTHWRSWGRQPRCLCITTFKDIQREFSLLLAFVSRVARLQVMQHTRYRCFCYCCCAHNLPHALWLLHASACLPPGPALLFLLLLPLPANLSS